VEKQKTIVLLFFLIIVVACALIVITGTYGFSSENCGSSDNQEIPVIILSQHNGTVTTLTGSTKPRLKAIPLSELKNVKVPPQVPTVPVNRNESWNQGLHFLKKYMIDLSEHEQEQLISDALKIINGNSTMSLVDQNKTLMKIGTYLILAENGGNRTQLGPDNYGNATYR
jgi:hypothetical protein